MDFFARLINTSDFPPRWQCGNWTNEHAWLHILSDLGVWSAYVAIPLVLGFFLLRRRDLPFRKICLLFVAFILACGTTHLMEALIFWWPAYRLAGVIKCCTAAVSWATVIALIPVVPRVLAMGSPEELEREVEARKQAEAALLQANAELEQRVAERTAALMQTNAALKLERERFRITLSSIGDAVIATDAKGRVTFLNSVAEELTGWHEEALGQDHSEVLRIFDEHTHEPVENPVQKVLREGRVVGLTNHTVLVAKDGTRHPIDDSAAPIRAENGGVLGAVMIFRDITEKQQAERAVRESEARYRAIGEAIDFGVWMCDQEGRNTYASESFLRLVGLTQQQCSEFGWGNALHPEDAERTITAWRECVRRGGVWDWEHRFAGVDGQWHHVLARGVPVRNSEGQLLGWVGINLDIDRLKQAEHALRENDRRKDEFLATLAHELRNPLAPVRNAVQLLRLTGMAQSELEWAGDVIDRQTQAMARLIDDLMDVSRISRGKLELRKERVSLASVVRGAIETSQPLVTEMGHQLNVRLPEKQVFLDADPARLSQVFLNLLNNAAKYTERKGQIDLTAELLGNDVVVRVRDNGIGIPASHLPTIFEMFSQVAGALSRSQGGLGIGLTLVKRLVEMHGGTVEAASAGPGKGSTFTVRLPTVQERQHPLDGAQNREELAASKLKILVVDDSKDIAFSLALLLRLMGNTVRTAHDGEEAVRAAREFRPQVTLLDIGLPKMNGYEACRSIRREDWGKSMVVVAVTGWGQEEDRKKSEDAGFDRHMVKPVDPQELLRLLAGLQQK